MHFSKVNFIQFIGTWKSVESVDTRN